MTNALDTLTMITLHLPLLKFTYPTLISYEIHTYKDERLKPGV